MALFNQNTLHWYKTKQPRCPRAASDSTRSLAWSSLPNSTLQHFSLIINRRPAFEKADRVEKSGLQLYVLHNKRKPKAGESISGSSPKFDYVWNNLQRVLLHSVCDGIPSTIRHREIHFSITSKLFQKNWDYQ